MKPALSGDATPRAALAEADMDAMFRLFEEHYCGAAPETFRRDLGNKDWVIRLWDAAGGLQGFSTFALYTIQYAGRPLSVVYSGDTLIRPAYWGTPELPRRWIKTVLEQSAGLPQPLYWLLISSGYKTYRFLTVFFREFFPRHDRATPPEMRALMDRLAGDRFGADYHRASGIVQFAHGATPLRSGVAELTPERMQDPHIAFFAAANPGHADGDELVCLTRVHPDNFTAAGRRMAR